uniref:Eukaryotic translation initiation factor 3 subunit F n=1 Tax=Globisporangium ultimum (strain ATCC 200006 / CBS 805.95 / DAOM BR144) TaxID=431595 RepID=K3W8M9_GLOUD
MAMNELILGTEAVCEVKVHPVVVFQILDRALRRSEEQDRVIGTLLGRVENGVAEITNSFAVPHLENGDEVAVGKDFHTQMYDLHQRVNENEVVVGWYATTADGMSVNTSLVDEHSCLIHEFYGSVCEMPVHVVIDTSLQTDQLQVSAFVSTPLEAAESALVNQFKQIQVTQKMSEPEAIALSAMAPKEDSESVSLPTELAALEASMERLYACLENASSYVSDVVEGKIVSDAKVGREIADALASIPAIRPDQFDQIFSSGLQDLLMVSYLSGLTQAQLSMAEKLINT